jgi:Protein of unknown function (DUF2637)
VTRWTARLALAGVSAIAAVVSYFHALAVVRAAGATPPVAYLVPFLADLVILGASAALLEASRGGHPRPQLATASLGAGIAVTVAMNVAAGVAHGLTGALVAGWPALAFILALESLVGMVRRGRHRIKEDVGSFLNSAAEPDEPPDLDADIARLLERHSQRKVAAAFGVPRTRVARLAPATSAAAAEVQLNGAGPHGS